MTKVFPSRRRMPTGLALVVALVALAVQLVVASQTSQSMSAAGYCYDNAFAESAFASLKAELLQDAQPFASKQAARAGVSAGPEVADDPQQLGARRSHVDCC